MKNFTCILILCCLFINPAIFCQVGIGTNSPNSSAILELQSNSKGFLPPRMTQVELNTISNPADGLIVYCTDCGVNETGAMAMLMNGEWYIFNITCLNPLSPAAGTHIPSPTQIIWNWNSVSGAIVYKWNAVNDYGTSIDLGASTSYTETGLTCLTQYTRYIWAYSSCGASTVTALTQSTPENPPASPTAVTHIPSPTQIIWNWNTVLDATGYKWNTNIEYGSATDMGTNTTITETGLSCNTSYTRYIWAYSSCGVSSAGTINQTTSDDTPISPVAGNHVPSTDQIVWKWHPISIASGYKWNTVDNYNSAIDMGSDTSKTDEGLYCATSYTRYVWAYNTCGISTSSALIQTTSTIPAQSPTSGTHIPSLTQIIWNWNSVPDATGYKWNTTDDYNPAIDIGTGTSKTETGLTCNSSYTCYVWAYSNCGATASTPLSQMTLSDNLSAPVAGTHVPWMTQIVWNWNVVSGATGYKWNTINDYNTAVDNGSNTTQTETGLTCNSSYTCYIWAYSTCGVSASTSLTQSTTDCCNPFTDSRDGQSYSAVLIGNQCWMGQNLNIGTMIISSTNSADNSLIEKYCYHDSSQYCNNYGGLYLWNEMMQYDTIPGIQGICPSGWYIPTENQWLQLRTYLGGEWVAGGAMKETGLSHWLPPNTGATNSSGFTCLPAGYRAGDSFYTITWRAYYWSSDLVPADYTAWCMELFHDSERLYIANTYLDFGMSVRCIRE